MKVAVVGCRGYGRVHLSVYSSLKVPVYVFSRDETAARECAKEYGALGYFTSFEEVLRSDADVVDLIVDHQSHLPMGLKALDAGKNLLLIKPIARTVEEGERLIRRAKEREVKFMVMENFYFDPSVWKAKELASRLGRLSLIVVRSNHLYKPGGWRAVKEKMGGGALIDGGVHFIDTLLNIGGEYERVVSMCANYFSEIEGEDTSVSIFKFRSGATGLLIYSWSVQPLERYPMFEIYGEKGSVIEDHNTRTQGKPYGGIVAKVNGKEERIKVDNVNSVEVGIRGFLDAVERGGEVPMPPELALRDLRAVIDSYKSCGEA
jgi:predicted dehydrogenase